MRPFGRVKSVVGMLLERILLSDRVLEVLERGLRGRLPRQHGSMIFIPDVPYEGLGNGRLRHHRRSRPIFISARFRTGSTLLWNMFKQAPGFTAYYEPFHPLVPEYACGRRKSCVSSSHPKVTDYWEEYRGLREIGAHHRSEWANVQLFMDETSWNPAMRRYIDYLLENASGIPVLQFNRVDFRMGWLREQYPNAFILHLYRHPRDQWLSVLPKPHSEVGLEMPLDAFRAYDLYGLLDWQRDLEYHFPCLSASNVSHPYQLFYVLWRLSHAFAVAYADMSISYEQLLAKPTETFNAALESAGFHLCESRAVEEVAVANVAGKWRAYASEGWFRDMEARCEDLLSQLPLRRMRDENLV